MMYCGACGHTIPPGQQFCSNCGRPVVQAVPVAQAPAPYFYTRVHRHIQSLSILWIAYAVWTLFGWLITISIFHGFLGNYFGHWNREPWNGPWGGPFAHMPWLIPVITVVLISRAILSLVAGLALVNRAPWARIFAIVAAFLTIIKPITGTALAIYTLWVLMPSASAREYDQIAQ